MIIPVDVTRDEYGYWMRPALTRSGCEPTGWSAS